MESPDIQTIPDVTYNTYQGLSYAAAVGPPRPEPVGGSIKLRSLDAKTGAFVIVA